MEFLLVEELSEVFLHALGQRAITPVLLGNEGQPGQLFCCKNLRLVCR
jgi:hypothetical protein